MGIELEIDVGHGRNFTVPTLPTGWSVHSDGSLANGREFVLNPPVTLTEGNPRVKALCERLVNMNVRRSGGMHVHVQVADYTHRDAYHLVKLYTHFQPVIDTLVGHSRVNNHYCPPYNRNVTEAELVRKFQLTSPARSRTDAKRARSYSAVNLAMMRCSNENDRTVEFRQGSVSKRFPCVAGWATLMVCLVDMAKRPEIMDEVDERRPTLRDFVTLIRQHETYVGGSGVADWVQWRYEYLNGEPTDEMIEKAVMALQGGYRGIFQLTRELDLNIAFMHKVLDKAVALNKISKHPTKPLWTVTYATIAADDLRKLEQAGEAIAESLLAMEASLPAVPTATPVEPQPEAAPAA